MKVCVHIAARMRRQDSWTCTQVEKRWQGWLKHRSSQSQYAPQLEWAAHVVEYVVWAYDLTKGKNGVSPLKSNIPLLGPRFLPPAYWHLHRRHSTPEIDPKTAYMKALTIVHPLYFENLAMCPKCDATGADIVWSGWTSTGHCEVHGLEREETALGYQLRCKRCAGIASSQKSSSKNGEGSYCFTTTNHTFWERREHWQIPGEYPMQSCRDLNILLSVRSRHPLLHEAVCVEPRTLQSDRRVPLDYDLRRSGGTYQT